MSNLSLAEELPREIERCQNLLLDYAEIGAAGTFASTMIKEDIRVAVKALAEGDVAGMLRSYETLKRCN